MGWASERAIEEHNYLMENDGEYHSRYMDWIQEQEIEGWRPLDETEIDWFDDYKLSHCGYEEYADDAILNAGLIGEIVEEDLPF